MMTSELSNLLTEYNEVAAQLKVGLISRAESRTKFNHLDRQWRFAQIGDDYSYYPAPRVRYFRDQATLEL